MPPEPAIKPFSQLARGAQIALLLALDGPALGGARMVCNEKSAIRSWITAFHRIDRTPSELPTCSSTTLPIHTAAEDLVGGFDLQQTLMQSKPVHSPGLLQRANGGLLQIASAGAQDSSVLSLVASSIDDPELILTTLLQVSDGDDESFALSGLLDRIAFSFAVDSIDSSLLLNSDRSLDDELNWEWEADVQSLAGLELDVIRERAAATRVPTNYVEMTCQLAEAIGVSSIRKVQQCVRILRLLAALEDKDVDENDLAIAAGLCMGWCASRNGLPEESSAEDSVPSDNNPTGPSEPAEPNTQAGVSEPQDPEPASASDEHEDNDARDGEVLNEAAQPDVQFTEDSAQPAQPVNDEREHAENSESVVSALLPEDLLADLLADMASGVHGRANRKASQKNSQGRRSKIQQRGHNRGRPIGVEHSRRLCARRLNFSATIRAAIPWQNMRRAQSSAADETVDQKSRLLIRPEDLHVTRFKQTRQNVTLFVVDASGSAARERLAEAKGAIELMLADCYVRRDEVALIVFQGRDAKLVLPPTRSLARTRRELQKMPGGGGTPLASALDEAAMLLQQLSGSGVAPMLCLLTDGRANVDRSGIGGRKRAGEQALQAAASIAELQVASLVIDIAPRPVGLAKKIADSMHSSYLALPRANSHSINQALQSELALTAAQIDTGILGADYFKPRHSITDATTDHVQEWIR